MEENKDPYKKLRIRLEETTTFPTEYMFKFVIPTDKKKIRAVKKMFNHLGAVITTKASRSNKYQSLTINVTMHSVDEIINKLTEVDAVGDVISL